jgi:hypothetical protein
MLLKYMKLIQWKKQKKLLIKLPVHKRSVFLKKYLYFLIDCDEFLKFDAKYKKNNAP